MISHSITKATALKMACELAQKFGFVSQKIVWKHLSHKARSSKYGYWRFLMNAPELAPYKVGVILDGYLVLSAEYKRYLGENSAVSNRSSIYFEHDEYLMDLILNIKSAGVVAEYWTEQELKMDNLLALKVLGGQSDLKIPDLLFDLKTDRGLIRVAIEMEKTRKSQRRYRQVQWGYSRLKRIELLIFGTPDSKTESAIAQEFDRAISSSDKRAIGYFDLNNFSRSGLGAELRIKGKSPKLGDFLKRVCGNLWQQAPEARGKIEENLRTSVHEKTLKEQEAK